MDINHANMTEFFQALSVAFNSAFNAKPAIDVNDIATVVPSTGAQTVHGWLNQLPGLREWLGDRQANNIESDKLTVVNRKFEGTLEMTREEIEDDNHGLYAPLAGQHGSAARVFKAELAVEALLNGNSDTWADGTAIFANDRTYGSATIDNYGTDAFDALGAQLSAAYTKMVDYKGHDGKPLMVRPTVLLHGPALRVNVKKALEQDYGELLASDASTYIRGGNPNKGLVQSLELPWLTDGFVDSKGTSHDAANYWFLMGTVGTMKGLFYQSRKEPEIQHSRLSLDSDFVFEKDKFQWGVRMRGAAFVGLPHTIYGSFAS